jgi:hypothetical protein
MRYLSICVVLAALVAALMRCWRRAEIPCICFLNKPPGCPCRAISWAAVATAATTTAPVTVRDRRMSETKYHDGVGVGD